MSNIIRMVVYSSVLFNRGGQVSNWAHSLEREYTKYATQFAPENKRTNKNRGAPGDLKRSIHGRVERVGAHGFQTTITVGVPYAMYVLRGTRPQITSHEPGKKMNLPDNSFWGTGPQRVVSGQRPQPFLLYAAVATGRTHSSVRGWSPY